MSRPKAPTPPDPYVTAGAQTATNIGTAVANNTMSLVDQVGPTGSLTYNQTGSKEWTDPNNGQTYDLPEYEAVTSLSPEQQAIFDQNQGAELNLATLANNQSGMLNEYMQQPISADALPEGGSAANLTAPEYSGVSDNFASDRRRVEDALWERQSRYLDRDDDRMMTQLANQGIKLGSDAFSDAMVDRGAIRNDARLATIGAAGQEQSRLVDQDMRLSAFDNDLADRNFNAQQSIEARRDQERGIAREEQFAYRAQPIQEISALLSGSQVALPQFSQSRPATLPTTDVAGLINNNYAQRLGAWQTDMQNRQSLTGGILGGIGSIAAGGLPLWFG